MQINTAKFLGTLFICLVLVFIFHCTVLMIFGKPIFDDLIIASYIINYVLASLLLIVVKSNFNKLSNHTAFIFMAISALKFVVFFVFFYPAYQEDNNMIKTEFAAFFIPYATSLILEVIYLSKQLNNQTYPSNISEEKKETK